MFEDSLKKAKETGMYKRLIKGDLITVTKKLIKDKEQFDLVFCSQVIEHITREEGEEIFALSEKLAKQRIFFGTLNGFLHQPEVFIKGNPHQHHKSGWTTKDLRRGYKVYGVGLKHLWSETGIARTDNKFLELLITIGAYVFNPLLYYVPSAAAGILAVKDTKK